MTDQSVAILARLHSLVKLRRKGGLIPG